MNKIKKKVFRQKNEDLEYIYSKNNSRNIFNNSNVLLTGASGFLGYMISEYLDKFIDKLNIQNLYLTDIKLNNIKKNYKKNTKFILHDIINDKIENISNKIDIIIHAASIASPVFYRANPLATADANVLGLRTILNFARNTKIKSLLYFSSSEIYGDPFPKFIPTAEDYLGNVSTTGPRACYDESKRFGETLCYIYNKEYNVPVKIVRPFNNYGPGMNLNDGRLPADLMKAIIKKQDINLYSDGKPTRSFCYITDAIIGYLEALGHGSFDVFNIGNSETEINVKDFAKIFSECSKSTLGRMPNINYIKNSEKEYLIDNPNRRCPNINKAKKVLGFKPEITIKKGINNWLNFLIEEKQ